MKTFCLHERKIRRKIVRVSFDPNFKQNQINTSDFAAEQTRPQNAGSAEIEFVSRFKIFVGKSDTNLARWCTFIR